MQALFIVQHYLHNIFHVCFVFEASILQIPNVSRETFYIYFFIRIDMPLLLCYNKQVKRTILLLLMIHNMYQTWYSYRKRQIL